MFRYALAFLLMCGPLIAAVNTPERFYVRAFGAVGDGVADDQPAILRAAQAVAKKQGRGSLLSAWVSTAVADSPGCRTASSSSASPT